MRGQELLVALIIVGAALCVLSQSEHSRQSKPFVNLFNYGKSVLARFFETVPMIPRNLQCAIHNGRDAIVIPLQSDENDIFVMDLFVSDPQICSEPTSDFNQITPEGQRCWKRFRVAVDTGSEALVLSGTGCAMNQNPKQLTCTLPAIRTGDAPDQVLTYGSQQDTVEWRDLRVMMRAWKMTCDENDDDAALTPEDSPEHTPFCLIGTVRSGVVHKRTGTSNYSILGLGAQGHGGVHSFLQRLFPNAKNRSFSIHVQSRKRARLILYNDGAITCQSPRFTIPVSRTQSHHHLVRMRELRFYTGRRHTPIDISESPDLLLDTGANAMSLPTSVYESLQRETNGGRGTLGIVLHNRQDEQFELRFSFNMADRDNEQVLDAGPSSKIIVGVTHLQNFAIGTTFSEDGTRYVTVDYFK